MSRRTHIQQIPPGSLVPAGVPARYRNADGYIRLRWKVGPYRYVEVYEHRVEGGVVVAADVERHHANGVRDDNSPSNLVTMTPEEHDAHHHRCDVLDDIVRLYEEGLSTPQVAAAVGRDQSVVYRHLKAQGVAMRNEVRKVTAEEREAIQQMFREGRTWQEISKATGRSTWAISRARRAL